jgi:hypothetical protein
MTYQGTAFLVHWKIRLLPGETEKRTLKLCPYSFSGHKEKNISDD